jgi:hypothetical protein
MTPAELREMEERAFLSSPRVDVPRLVAMVRELARRGIDQFGCSVCDDVNGDAGHHAEDCPLVGWSYADAHPEKKP